MTGISFHGTPERLSIPSKVVKLVFQLQIQCNCLYDVCAHAYHQKEQPVHASRLYVPVCRLGCCRRQ